MNNVSLNNESIILSEGKEYFLIDGLYLNTIRENLDSLDRSNLEQEIREKVFPYTDTPFAKYSAKSKTFNLSNIKKIEYSKVREGDTGVFSTDTGLLLLIQEEIFCEFLENYCYDDLLDSLTEPINRTYWRQLKAKFSEDDVALILSPGIDSGFDFEGSGTYQVSQKL